MVDRRASATGGQRGFTLLELMIASGILIFAATTLVGALSLGAGTARGAEMRSRAVLLAESVLQEVELGMLTEHPLPDGWESVDELQIPSIRVDRVDGFPDMKYAIEFTIDPERPELVLAAVRIQWREQGELGGQVFRRVLRREIPFSTRVTQRRRSQ